jgi:exosortase E/protease (VPEID-CTERM system)
MFVVVAIATIIFTEHVARANEAPWMWFTAYCCLLLLHGASLALVAAPTAFWTSLPTSAPVELILATAGATFVQLAGELARESWHHLSTATLVVAARILSLYEPDTVVDIEGHVIGLPAFRVIILPECSGYEGVGLVVAFLTLYLWILRKELRFPNALLLVPIGICAIWLLNAVRIAALISIGAHLSPSIAANGFHSQAGWITFLLVTLSIVALAHQSRFTRRRLLTTPNAGFPRDRALYALLLPFIGLMGTTILAAAAAPNGEWLYLLKVAVVGGILWAYRDVYAKFLWQRSTFAGFVGITVGALWIATDPAQSQETPLKLWLTTLPLSLAALWIGIRAFGSIVVVPIAEELAFRGYLHRALISRNFHSVRQAEFTWLAFVVSSVAFGVLHERWLAGMLAGAVFAILMYRTGNLAAPIAAHMTANATIMMWAVGAQRWSLL